MLHRTWTKPIAKVNKTPTARSVRLIRAGNALETERSERCEEWNKHREHEKSNGTTEKRFCRAEKVSQQSDLQPMIQPSRPGFPGGGLGASRARPDFFSPIILFRGSAARASGGRMFANALRFFFSLLSNKPISSRRSTAHLSLGPEDFRCPRTLSLRMPMKASNTLRPNRCLRYLHVNQKKNGFCIAAKRRLTPRRQPTIRVAFPIPCAIHPVGKIHALRSIFNDNLSGKSAPQRRTKPDVHDVTNLGGEGVSTAKPPLTIDNTLVVSCGENATINMQVNRFVGAEVSSQVSQNSHLVPSPDRNRLAAAPRVLQGETTADAQKSAETSPLVQERHLAKTQKINARKPSLRAPTPTRGRTPFWTIWHGNRPWQSGCKSGRSE